MMIAITHRIIGIHSTAFCGKSIFSVFVALIGSDQCVDRIYIEEIARISNSDQLAVRRYLLVVIRAKAVKILFSYTVRAAKFPLL